MQRYGLVKPVTMGPGNGASRMRATLVKADAGMHPAERPWTHRYWEDLTG